ncbi:Zn-dependent hydrolase [Alteribacter lacisalsi]|uniref:Zn-dependent hydrolase n=1 Tax=Alteribacter lacisalsi TaxID=2045244 RepID=A0A2W0H7A3_9BACI|nr:M20 family metallo-hydrolase [Alteribacter lacisalsi]PYZ95980.1 Zn-dependent hydrolase [Alteribacter lacisalsi]
MPDSVITEQLAINKDRLSRHMKQLSEYGRLGETGVCRPTLSPVEKEAFGKVAEWMEEAGMTVRLDNFGNLIGRKDGKDPDAPVVMTGSHIDSQPAGGRFDGTVGVLSSIEAVHTMSEKGIIPDRPIEVVSFCDEEGWRFGKGLFGSRGITGNLEAGELDRKDADGITRRQALREFGCDPDKIPESRFSPESIHSFLELHIEQGPLLEKADQPAGIVTGIAGPIWLTVKVKGFAGHAGTVPMAMRQDALVGASEMIVAFHEIVKEDPEGTTVGTVGELNVSGASRNVIPEEVAFTIDLRDIDLDRRNRCEELLRESFQRIAEKYHLKVDITEDQNTKPSYCSPWIQDIIDSESQALGLNAPTMMSGAFHDALVMSSLCDYGMIFVRCREGISHNPKEYASDDDLAVGAELLYRTLLRLAGDS